MTKFFLSLSLSDCYNYGKISTLTLTLFDLPQNINNDKTRQLHKSESGEEAQKETMRLIDIGLPQSKIILTVTVRPGSKVSSRFTPVVSIRTVLSCFYLLIS